MLSSWAPLALAAALACWPYRPGRSRVRRLAGAAVPNWPFQRLLPLRPGAALAVVGAALGGLMVAGPAGAVAAALAAGTALVRWRARRHTGRTVAATADLASALGLLAAELRAGAHPAAAADRVATDAPPGAAAVLSTIAATARLCGDVAAALHREALATPALRRPLAQLAAAWTLAQEHGIPLANVLDAVHGDLDHQVRAQRGLHASLAGPRATAAVLAALPVVGLLLGQAVGAQPWRVLTGGAAGQLLLMTGTLLICAGLVWSAHLVSRAAAS